jgi:hypothetical protein
MDDAFKRLEELVAVPAKKKRVLTPEQKARKAEQNRKRRAENPEKLREAARKRRAKNPEKEREAARKRYAENPEKGRERARKWYAENQENGLEAARRRRAENPEKANEATRKWRADNPEKKRALYRKWCAENPEKKRALGHRHSEAKAPDCELFAINQAVHYAVTGSATRDITANCPEPTRSRLQALVDQIKADPSAGKRVVGLLRSMRELRKLELAEIKQATETETEN